MRNIIIALIDENDYKKVYSFLNKEKNIYIYEKDILYEEAIFDLLKEKDNYNEIIINEDIIIDIKKYIKLMKNGVKIQIIVNSKSNIERFIKYGFTDINTINDYLYKNMDIKSEIKEFKDISTKQKNAEIIAFTGERKSGKTTLAINFLNLIENKKILFLNFNYNMDVLCFLEENYVKQKSIFTREINKNEVTFYIFLNKFINERFINELKKLINQYEMIIIDIDDSINSQLLKTIFNYCDKVYFIVEPVYIEINNSIRIIEYFLKKKILNINNIKIIFNKYDLNAISIVVLKDIFKKYHIECVVRRRKKYKRILNKEVKYGS